MSSVAGEFVTETLEYDGGRQVTAYEAADPLPTMIVGAHRVGDETLRLHEYSPGRSTGVRALSWPNGSARTATPCGNTSSH